MAQLTRRDFLTLAAGLAGATVVAGCDPFGSGPAVTPASRAVEQIHRERRLPGTRNWRVRRSGAPHEIEGFTAPAAGPPGQQVRLFVSSTHRRVRIEAFRMGWYGGDGARQIWHDERVPVADQQSAVRFVAATRTVSAAWRPTVTVDTSGWPEGAYLFRLSVAGAQRFVPYVVSSTDTTGRVLLVHATATWQAYNDWGGYSLYHGPGGLGDYANRAYVVSFDRPYPLNGAESFLSFERPVVELAERLDLPVAHTTSAQLHTDPRVAGAAKAVVSLGHDEYWSPQMRAHVTAARDHGTNVAFLGANACFRRIRFAASPLGADREVICYKTSYQLDPLYGKDNRAVTNDWPEPPDPDPESSLTGTQYEGYPTSAALVITTPDAWVFRGTGVRAGEAFPDLIGPEYDRVDPAFPTPRPIEVLAHSPLTCKGVHSYSDMAYYTHHGGAGVFNVGTMHWVAGLTRRAPYDARTRRFVAQVTANVLHGFAAGPAAARLPARDNLHQIHAYAGDPLATGHNLW